MPVQLKWTNRPHLSQTILGLFYSSLKLESPQKHQQYFLVSFGHTDNKENFVSFSFNFEVQTFIILRISYFGFSFSKIFNKVFNFKLPLKFCPT